MNIIPTIDGRMLQQLKNLYWCEDCGKTFREKKEYQMHKNTSHV
jgi:uncharacterized C2H2 Zn-finger protein